MGYIGIPADVSHNLQNWVRLGSSVYLETKVKAKETCVFSEVTVDVGEGRRLAAFLLLPREPEPLSI